MSYSNPDFETPNAGVNPHPYPIPRHEENRVSPPALSTDLSDNRVSSHPKVLLSSDLDQLCIIQRAGVPGLLGQKILHLTELTVQQRQPLRTKLDRPFLSVFAPPWLARTVAVSDISTNDHVTVGPLG